MKKVVACLSLLAVPVALFFKYPEKSKKFLKHTEEKGKAYGSSVVRCVKERCSKKE